MRNRMTSMEKMASRARKTATEIEMLMMTAVERRVRDASREMAIWVLGDREEVEETVTWTLEVLGG